MSKINYYAVAAGRRPGIYNEWYGPEGAEVQVAGYAGALHRGFRTRAEAEAWLRSMSSRAEQHRPPEDGESKPKATPAKSRKSKRKAKGHEAALAAGKVVIYTDGGCSGNPGPGGYGAVLLYGAHRKELSAGYRRTTNNRMELRACIAALHCLKRPSDVVLYSDSQYVVKGITLGWARKWRGRGWKRSNGEMAENIDLWAELLELCEKHRVEFVWVRGHMGTAENERCDRLAVAAAQQPDLPADPGFR